MSTALLYYDHTASSPAYSFQQANWLLSEHLLAVQLCWSGTDRLLSKGSQLLTASSTVWNSSVYTLHPQLHSKISKNRFHFGFHFWSGFPYGIHVFFRDVMFTSRWFTFVCHATPPCGWHPQQQASTGTFTSATVNHCIFLFLPKM